MPFTGMVKDVLGQIKELPAAMNPNPDFALGGRVLEGALGRYKRKKYGIPDDIANRYADVASANAYTAGQGVVNQIKQNAQARGLGRSAMVLSAPQAGARAQSEVLQQQMLPMTLQNAQMAEGQRTTDLTMGQQLLELLSRRDLTKAQFAIELARIKAAKDSQPGFSLSTPVGGISF